MSTIAHPFLLIMAQWLASIIIKTGAKIDKLSQTSIFYGLKSVISTAIATLLLQIMCTFATNLNEMMIIAVGEPLFPFRTEKLSLFAPMVR